MAPVTTLRRFADRLRTVFFRSGMSRVLRLAAVLAAVLLLVFCLLQLLLRFVLLPQIGNYRGEMEQQLSAAIRLPVSIGSIEGRMQGIRPRLELRNLDIKDASGRPALSFNNVVGVLGWTSLLRWSPSFDLLEVTAPELAVRRDAAGIFFVAGLQVNTDRSGPDLSAWLLDQDTVAIRNARVTWTDELRQAPALTLENLNLQLESTFLGHRFGLTALPPAALSGAIDLRGKFRGDSINEIAQWEGELYGQVENTNLSGWQAWVEYPVELPRGNGSARVWLDFANLNVTAVTADLALADTQVRLAPELKMLVLRKLNGRVTARKTKTGFELTTRQLSLGTADGVRMTPTNLNIARDDKGGEFNTNTIDFKALAALAAYLPLPQALRRQLEAYAPHGSLNLFRLHWQGQSWPLDRYTVKGSFKELGFSSVGGQPGFSGLSGTIDGNERSGMLKIDGRPASLTLPAVFNQPLGFDALQADVSWKHGSESTEFELAEVKFSNADTQGVASGTYQTAPEGKGIVDLDAALDRADAAAVWKYMPLQAGSNVGPFLHAGLTQGKVGKTTLKLKGDLTHFPFADRSGTFRIHGVFDNAVLRYAEDWPQIDGIAGTLDFDGPRMIIRASKGSILGTSIGPVSAEIADLMHHDELLLVEGKAAGQTMNFLEFIEASPVAAQIDSFTDDMTASGSGALDLKLTLPLRRIHESLVSGSYRFDENQLLLAPDVPPLENVRGQIDFTQAGLSAKGVTAAMYGLPFKLELKTQDGGSVLAEVSGEASMSQLRRRFAHAGLKNLAGSTRWQGTVKARKKSAEVRISSDLVGISSSLPEPFNKSASEAMPLLFQRKPVELKLPIRSRDRALREMTELSLGRALRAQLVYRHEAAGSRFERGQASIGEVAIRMPERGLVVAIYQQRLNADLWRTLLSDQDEKPAGGKTGKTSAATDIGELSPIRLDLRSNELQAMGRIFHDVRIAMTQPAEKWMMDINSRELAAQLEWFGGDRPKLSGRISRLALPEAATASAVSKDSFNALPDLDLTLDHLNLNGRNYGELKLAAENKGNDWNATFSVRNDDGALEGQGRWRLSPVLPKVSRTSDTEIDFKLHAKSIERFLNRIGHPNMVRRGTGDLNGRLTWTGAPDEFDLATLNGQISLDLRNGQFNKLEPGVGRLLGVLSLQSVQRRLALDFRDIFSEGFAFDRMHGQMNMVDGVATTENMEIRGPAAKVQMAGNVDLVRETQDLKVRVQPSLSESVTTGALFLNPAVGATAWAFNKLFGNPLDNVFGYDFTVSGGWSDPKVEKIAGKSGNGSNTEAGK
jgi:uncharacterized protein (TIGR02099 family)